ncbi:MAG: glycosyltransferase [Candidatus Woesearchaeota archaeon]
MKKILFVYDKNINLNKISVLYQTPKIYSENGFDVHVICEKPINKKLKNKCKNVRFKTYSPARLNKKITNKYLLFLKFKIEDRINRNKLKKKIKKENFDIIYLMGVNSILAGKKIKDKQKVHRFFGTWDLYESIKKNKKKRILYFETIKAMGLKNNLTILTNDGTDSDKIYNIKNKGKYLFLINGVDNKISKKKKRKKEKKKKIFLGISRLVNIKKPEKLIYIAKEYKKLNKNFKLIILGDGPERKKLEKIINKKKLETEVILKGKVDNEVVQNYLNQADLIISTYDVSNLGNPFLEAMNAEKPIFTFENNELKKIIKHKKNGFIYENKSSNYKVIAKDINKYLENNKFQEEMKKNIKKTKKEIIITWEERIKKEIKEVKKLL